MPRPTKPPPALYIPTPADGPVAGVDEAGRGPWAGPVVCAAVILDPARVPQGLADSKTLKLAVREALCTAILATAHVGVAAGSARRIDRLNVLAATMEAMQRAVARLGVTPARVLVDGNRAPDLPVPVETLVKGDARHAAIAAASIVAKTLRDRAMHKLAVRYPAYGWDSNAGYGVRRHQEALDQAGVTKHHRVTFAPIRKLLTLND